MRVLRVLPSVDPQFGGPSESASRSCIAAQRAGIETSVVVGIHPSSEERSQPILAALRSNGVTVYELPIGLGSFGRRNALIIGLNRKIHELRQHVDLIHLHSPWAGSSIMTMTQNSSARFVMTPHEGFTNFDVSHSNLRAIKILLLQRYGRALKAVLYSSSLEASDSVLRGPTAYVVPHPVVDETRPTPSYGRDGTVQRTFGYLGRLHPKKNIELCIRATAQLPNVRLIIAGDGPAKYRAALRRLAEESGAASRVEFVGFIQPSQKPSYFKAIDGLLLVSDFECFGMAAAEALANSVPVIVSHTTGVSDVVARFGCGFIVDRSVDSLADAMQSMLTAPRKPMMDGAYEAALTEYSFASHAQRIGVAYLRCSTGQ